MVAPVNRENRIVFFIGEGVNAKSLAANPDGGKVKSLTQRRGGI